MARIMTTDQAGEKLQVKPLTIRKYLRRGLTHGTMVAPTSPRKVADVSPRRVLYPIIRAPENPGGI